MTSVTVTPSSVRINNLEIDNEETVKIMAEIEEKELEQYISTSTRKMLLEYSGIKDAFVIRIKKVELTDVIKGDWTKKLMTEGVLEDIY